MGRAAPGYLEDEDNFEILQYLLYVLNTVFFLVGALIFAAGMYIRFDDNMQDVVEGSDLQFYWSGTIVLIIAACLVMLNSFIGCCSAFFANKKSLIWYMIFTVLTFAMLLGGSAYLLHNGLEDSNLYPYLQVQIKGQIQRYQWNITARRNVDIIQEFVGCCGGTGDEDYLEIHLPIPDTCRHHITGNQYTDSCARALSQYLEDRTGWICGLSLCLCLLQLFAVVIAVYAYIFIKRIEKTL